MRKVILLVVVVVGLSMLTSSCGSCKAHSRKWDTVRRY